MNKLFLSLDILFTQWYNVAHFRHNLFSALTLTLRWYWPSGDLDFQMTLIVTKSRMLVTVTTSKTKQIQLYSNQSEKENCKQLSRIESLPWFCHVVYWCCTLTDWSSFDGRPGVVICTMLWKCCFIDNKLTL